MLKWGREEETLLEIQATTGITPIGLSNKPTLAAGLVGVWGAYNLLNGSRLITEAGPSPIPLTEIKAYLDITKIDDVESRLYVVRMVRTLDNMYLENYAEKSKQSLSNGK